MSSFFIQIIEALPVALVALPMGWVGSMLQSYASEKGKNLATKEDVQEITKKLETTKSLSNALVERKIRAIDEITVEVSELYLHCHRQLDKDNEHAVPLVKLPSKNGFQRSVHMGELSSLNSVFLSEEITEALNEIIIDVFMMGHMERHADFDKNGNPQHPEMLDTALYGKILFATSELKKKLHIFLYSHE